MMERRYPGGPVRYFHHPAAREVWAIPEKPDVSERCEAVTKRRRHPSRIEWLAHVTIEHIRASNWLRPDNGRWHYRHAILKRQSFSARNSLDDVLSQFGGLHAPTDAVEVTHEEYVQLKEAYLIVAKSNPPPIPLPPFES